MVILHVSILGNELALWGEESVESGSHGSFRKRPGRGIRPRPHPFAASALRLSALENAVIGFTPAKKRIRVITAWLPTRGLMPYPSSSMLGEISKSPGRPVISSWRVPVYPLHWTEATEFLAQCGDKNALAQGVIAGEETLFWVRVFRFGGSLAARQQFLPGIRGEKNDGRAIWEPVLIGQDALHAGSLVEAMPPSAFALSENEGRTPPQVDRRRALIGALTGFVDHIVRSGTLGAAPGSPPRNLRDREVPESKSVHDRWLQALRSPDGKLKTGIGELRRLESEIAAWRRSIDVVQDSRFRLCFRLDEPAGTASGRWHLRYLIQSLDDRSLLVPLDSFWNARTSHPLILKHLGPRTKEQALSSLAHAATLSPPIEKSMKRAAPAGCTLTTNEAHQFLGDTAFALDQAGFGVMLPTWWSRKGTKLRLAARGRVSSPAMHGQSAFSFDSIADFQWELALGDKSLTKQELDALARLKAPLVKLRGQWVEVNSEELRKAVVTWDTTKQDQKTVGEIVRMDLTGTGQIFGIPIEGVSATGWIGALLKKLRNHETFEELPPPDGFSGILRPYQLRGFSWLSFLRQWGFGTCLADDMGLGKTVQVLALIQRDREAGVRRPVLVICPTSVVNNWSKEAARFTPELPLMVHHGIDRRRGEALTREAEKSAVVISTYALMQRDLEHLRGINWAGIILDEAQNIKNPEAKQSRAAYQLQGGYRIALSGTPVENTVGDLWSIFQFLNPGLLGTKAEFKRTYFLPIQIGQDEGAVERLKRITGPFILRRLKTDKSIISDLPEKMEMKVFCSLTREQASLYQSVLKVVEEELPAADGIKRRGVILATLSRLKQVCNHPAHFLGDNSSIPGRSGKVARLTEMIEEVIASGERALVFTQFAEMGKILKTHLQETFGREILFLYGATPRNQRDEMVERFQAEHEGPPVFVLSLKAGGTGLNLTGANHVFHFDRWWNPAVEQQATDRTFRIGQKKNVQVYKFVCAGTLEEKIDEMIERKRGIAEKVVGSGEGWLTELSNDELRDIFALKPESVEDQ